MLHLVALLERSQLNRRERRESPPNQEKSHLNRTKVFKKKPKKEAKGQKIQKQHV